MAQFTNRTQPPARDVVKLNHYVNRYKSHLGPDSKMLVANAAGGPVVAVESYGRGRVVALCYVNHGLSPEIDWRSLGKENDCWGEYFYSLLGPLRFRGGNQEGGFDSPECGWISDVVREG